MAKLTASEVREIHDLKGLFTQNQIAKKYGISQANVSLIQLGLSWKCLEPDIYEDYRKSAERAAAVKGEQ